MAIPQAVFTKLERYDTPTICNVIELFDVRPDSEGFMDGRIRSAFPEMPPMVGEATTAGFRSASPNLGGDVYASLEAQLEQIISLDSPAVIVFQDYDDPPVGATFGEVMCSVYQAFGARGLITSGGGRDLTQVRAIGFPVFTGSTICSHGYSQIVEVGRPVRVGGLVVRPGDLLHGDANGITNIPIDIAAEVAEAAAPRRSKSASCVVAYRASVAVSPILMDSEGYYVHIRRTFAGQFSLAALLIVISDVGVMFAAVPESDSWAQVTEDDRAIKIETEKLEAVIPKNNPRQWMTGIEKGSFLDKATGFREVGDGLMVVDWLMEAGSDESWSDQVIAPDGNGVGRYTWHTNETEPSRRLYALMAHGSSHRKRMVEGPQLCHRMKPVQPEIIRGRDFVAVKTTYKFEYAAPGRTPGSQWTQLIVFPKGERYFVLMDKIDSVNDSDGMFLRNDTPGCVRHENGDTFSEIYLSYLSGSQGVRIPSSEFFTPFPPDLKFGYRRDTHKTPERFIRAYHLRDKTTGNDGPWLAGLTLAPAVVYEAWCSQRSGGIIVMIEEVHGKPVKAGESFSAAHIVGYFDTIEDMHKVYDRYSGHTALTADASGWRLEK